MTDTLKPCPNPWCSALERDGDYAPKVIRNSIHTRHIACSSCGMEGPKRSTERQAITAWNTRATAPAWPENARFQYGDAVRVIVKREGQPRFPGYIIGWYQPLDGRHTGWVLEHERDGIIHVYPDAAVEELKP